MTGISIFRPTKGEVNSFFNERDNFIRSFDHVFDSMLTDMYPFLSREMGVSLAKGSYPKVNVAAYDDRVEITAELAGFKKEDIDLQVEDNTLTISGKSVITDEEREAVYYVRELKRSAFKRSFQITENLDLGKVDAKFDNGLLVITIPKILHDETKAKTVTIK